MSIASFPRRSAGPESHRDVLAELEPHEDRLRVLVLSPLRFFAEALAAELSRYPHLVAVARVGIETDASPDVLLIEVHGPSGLELVRRSRDRFPGAPIIALGVEERPEQVLACVESGAAGYVPREATVPELVTAIERASRGEALCPPVVMGQLFRRMAVLAREPTVDPVAAAVLTPREREVAAMLGRGLSNKAIARQLGVRIPTVKTHVHQVLRKLGATSRLALLAATRHRPDLFGELAGD